MYKIIYIIYLFFSLFFTAASQTNLVPNPSFESVVQCPFSLGIEAYTSNWKSARATPDYFNVCSTATIAGVPVNSYGFQQPNSGNAYIGMITYRSDNSNFTEAVSVQLLTPLSIGQTYYVSFKVSLTLDLYNNELMSANNKIGVQFSKVGYSPSSPLPINNFAHIWTDSIITDTLAWTTVKGIFVADSSYTHLSLGNFFDKQNIDSIVYVPTYGAYYYFDDVCVSTDSTICYENVGITKFIKVGSKYSIFPNPFSNHINISNEELTTYSLCIYDSYGQIIINENNINIKSKKIDMSLFKKGLFFIQIKNDTSILNYKLLKQ